MVAESSLINDCSDFLVRRVPTSNLPNCVSRTLPFAAIITPGTLSVDSRPHTNSTSRTVWRLSSDPDAFISQPVLSTLGPVDGLWTQWIQHSTRLHVVAFTAATSSQIIPNQTYFTTFFGPALRCTDANSTTVAEASNYARNTGSFLPHSIAWVGDTDSVPWSHNGNSSSTFESFKFQTVTPNVYGPGREFKTESNSLWFIWSNSSYNDNLLLDFRVKECQLWNASYEIEVAYRNFEQTTIVHNYHIGICVFGGRHCRRTSC